MSVSTPDRDGYIEQTLELLLETVQNLDKKVAKLDEKVVQLDQDVRAANERTDTYWEASKLLINLAFGLIATAVIAIIVPTVIGS